ncbi:MAG TPA: guanylate kinase [Gemmatimonadales bacterium]|nr:guanylate kinase [Gemmatimonadales bacterium]
MKPFLLVLSSPSGGGKTTIARKLLQGRDDLAYSVSATTRPRREGERDGVDYFFLTRDEFERRVAAGEFVEWATYAGHLYGTLRGEVERILAGGKHAVLDIEIDGARQVRRSFPDAVLVYVLPPSASALMQRLRGRNTEPPEVLQARLARALDELTVVREYDYVIVNDDLFTAVAEITAILDAEARRPSRQDTLWAFIEELRGEVAAAVGKLGGAVPSR